MVIFVRVGSEVDSIFLIHKKTLTSLSSKLLLVIGGGRELELILELGVAGAEL